MPLNGNTIIITVDYNGRIPLLGVNGPIVVPTPLSRSMVANLVHRGYRVYSHNPARLNEKKLITNATAYDNLWPAKEPAPPKPVNNIGTTVPKPTIGIPVNRKPPIVETPAPVAEPTPEPVKEVVPEPTPEPAVAPVAVKAPVQVDPYAGMSKNQRKKAKAAAAAKAAAEKAAAANQAGN